MYFFFFLMIRRPPRSTRTDTLFPYTTLFRSVVHHAEGVPHVALMVDEEASGIQRAGSNPGDLAVVDVELEQECVVDRTRDQHRIALARQRIHDPVEVAVRDHHAAAPVDVRRIQVAQADLKVETPGLEARRVQDA